MLRAVTDADLPAMLRWRNHPDVRAASFTTHEIGSEEHLDWWRRTAADPTREVLVHERGGVACGVVALTDIDPVGGSAEWGFYLDNAGLTERGEMLAAWVELEREAVCYAFDTLGVGRLGGYTVATNEVVLALHRRFGFREVSRESRTIDGVAHDVVRTELRADERRDRRR